MRADQPQPAKLMASRVSTSRGDYGRFMWGIVTIAALVGVTVAACAPSQPAALDAPPPPPATNAPASTGSIPQAPAPGAQTPMPQQACTQQVAAEIVEAQHTLQASNDPCVVCWRSFDVRQHPERAFYLECNGLKAYPDPQPIGHPVSLAECDRKLRNIAFDCIRHLYT